MTNSFGSSKPCEEDCKTCELTFRYKNENSCIFENNKRQSLCPCRMCLFKFNCYHTCDEYDSHIILLKKEVGDENV